MKTNLNINLKLETMTEIDNKKLDLLLSLRELIRNETSIISNNYEKINNFYLSDHDNDTYEIYDKFKDHILKSYEIYRQEREELLQDVTRRIDDTCCHEYVNDEIEHVYSGDLIKIRYCCICEKTV